MRKAIIFFSIFIFSNIGAVIAQNDFKKHDKWITHYPSNIDLPFSNDELKKIEEAYGLEFKKEILTNRILLKEPAIGFSDKNELRGRYVDTSQENFKTTMDISVYSFTAATARAEKLMSKGGSILTLTYYGAEKVMPHYNVMGLAKAALEASVKYLAEDLGKDKIRVNAISAGPIKTLASSGIGDFRYIMKWNEYNSPLRRTVTQEEVGNSALYLLSDLGSAVTGEVLHVDAGYHVVGMKAVDAPDMEKL